jgi:hypothetical protein
LFRLLCHWRPFHHASLPKGDIALQLICMRRPIVPLQCKRRPIHPTPGAREANAQAPCNYSEIRAIADIVLLLYLSEDIGLCRRHSAPTLLQDETSGSCSGQWNTKCSTENNYIVPHVDICPQEIFCSTREQLLERRPIAPQKIYFSI